MLYIFQQFFRFINQTACSVFYEEIPVPEDFLLNHISGSFVEMVQWWVRKNKMQATPKELNAYFQTVIEPLL